MKTINVEDVLVSCSDRTLRLTIDDGKDELIICLDENTAEYVAEALRDLLDRLGEET